MSARGGPPDPGRSRLGPFRHRPFTVYWAGGLLSNLGSWLQAVAGSIFIYQLTGSALAVGVLNFAAFLPILLFSIAGGVISDRFDRRRIVIVTHLVSAGIAVILALATMAGVVGEIHLIVAAFALNTAYALAKPSIIAILPGLVPRDEMTDAVGLNTLQFIVGQILGPLIAALVMASAGAAAAFGINALTYVGPIIAMVYLGHRGLGQMHPQRGPDGKVVASPVGAIAFIREQSWVLALLIGVVAVSAPLEIVRTLSPAIAVESLGEPDSTAGVIVAAQSVGSALALVVFVRFRRLGWSAQMVSAGLILQAVGLAGTALAPTLPVALVMVGLVGFGFSLCFPILTGRLQLELPDSVRGRIMSVHQVSHLGNRPLVALAVGVVATVASPALAIILGCLLAPVGLVASRSAFRRLEARPAGGARSGPAGYDGHDHDPKDTPTRI
jgi:MFS family permease